MTRRMSGFTLIELVIVIAVIAILAALLVPTIVGQVARARDTRALSDVGELGRAISRMRTDTSVSGTGCVDVLSNLTALSASTGCTPTGAFSAGLSSCTTAKPGVPCWGGPYVAVLPDDPWSAPYYATLNTSTYTVLVGSPGADGVGGNGDDDTSIQ